VKSKSKYIVREILNYWGVFENKRLSNCIVYCYNKKVADNYCKMMNDNPKGDVLEKEAIIKKE
jgi:hypothetical protein